MRFRTIAGIVFAASALGLALVGSGSAQSAAPLPTCAGKTATIVSEPTTTYTYGTNGRDVIVGNSQPGEYIYGRGGIDVICGRVGEDRIYGGDGGDELRGETGPDRLVGEGGRDVLVGGPGNDTCYPNQPGGLDDPPCRGD